ncbi:MAG: hypothetical protein ACREBC_27210 [Pyrinomonadaceae bacterium]
MGTPKLIGLGAGLRRAVSYDELESRLRKEGVDATRTRQVLKKAFPKEFAAEEKAARAAEKAAHAEQLRKIKESRWKDYLGELSPTVSSDGHRAVVRRVSAPRPPRGRRKLRNRVTDFSNWIYEAMPYARIGPEHQDAGKAGEREVAKLKRLLRPISDGHSDWKLIDRDPLDAKPKSREISLLKVGNDSLFGAPDYVFHNPKENSILIVEVKVSNPRSFPPEGWPNLRAQLWAYGNTDYYIDLASKVILIGEIWGKAYNAKTRQGDYRLLRTYRWDMSDTVFCEQNEELFDIYQHRVCNSQPA